LMSLTQVNKIYCGTNYSYAITRSNECYSWGSGDNYVLGTRKDDTAYEPYQIQKDFYNNEKVIEFGLGAQHVIVMTAPQGQDRPPLEVSVFKKVDDEKGNSKENPK